MSPLTNDGVHTKGGPRDETTARGKLCSGDVEQWRGYLTFCRKDLFWTKRRTLRFCRKDTVFVLGWAFVRKKRNLLKYLNKNHVSIRHSFLGGSPPRWSRMSGLHGSEIPRRRKAQHVIRNSGCQRTIPSSIATHSYNPPPPFKWLCKAILCPLDGDVILCRALQRAIWGYKTLSRAIQCHLGPLSDSIRLCATLQLFFCSQNICFDSAIIFYVWFSYKVRY